MNGAEMTQKLVVGNSWSHSAYDWCHRISLEEDQAFHPKYIDLVCQQVRRILEEGKLQTTVIFEGKGYKVAAHSITVTTGEGR